MIRERIGFVNDTFYCIKQEWVGATPLHVSLQNVSEPLNYFQASSILQIAEYNGHHNLFKLLLSAGADVSAGDHCTRNGAWKKHLKTLHILVEGGTEEEFLNKSRFLEKTDMP
ncbi:uncharacterized protein Bfra_001227 [Botrytis fragariae]|uniref:Ankyrin repeat protein n=1 Tax=Botrytis fragariae TaxID=1964551 RepID=A0A8H6ELQ6_9HELO|nr:uncharacterized protein Bfra_001227 [Botrytis fragariae]KAF5876872.1 hypothetical protein Bfra_001227 [Botrytis fragariae]